MKPRDLSKEQEDEEIRKASIFMKQLFDNCDRELAVNKAALYNTVGGGLPENFDKELTKLLYRYFFTGYSFGRSAEEMYRESDETN